LVGVASAQERYTLDGWTANGGGAVVEYQLYLPLVAR
jgi:hypothetical protein